MVMMCLPVCCCIGRCQETVNICLIQFGMLPLKQMPAQHTNKQKFKSITNTLAGFLSTAERINNLSALEVFYKLYIGSYGV